jgi:hypothetical protein
MLESKSNVSTRQITAGIFHTNCVFAITIDRMS